MEEIVTLTKIYAYYCPMCGCRSRDMELKTEGRIATEEEMRKKPHIATELLLCTCGRTWSWFDLEEKFEGGINYETGQKF
jgi:hypothetical protein